MEKNVQRVFKFRKDIDFGSVAAENDSFLKDCFLDTGDLDVLLNTSHPKRIIIGRTGTGKTAILEEIRRRCCNIITIDPEALSLQYLSNSTILEHLRVMGIHLELFYKLLWRHIFTVELIKCHYKLEDLASQKAFLSSILSHIGSNKRKRKAIEYLVDWSDSFWESTEYRIKEITEKLEEKVKTDAGIDAKWLKVLASDSSGLTKEQKSEVLYKAQRAVNNIQITELNDLLSLMETDIFKDPQKEYYILIDDLDKDWVDSSIVYDLIKALIEVVYDFSHHLKNAKIVIALRENILEKVLRTESRGAAQIEKYESLLLKLHWTREQLIEILELRLKQIIIGYYTKEISPTVKDLLPQKSKNKPDGMTFILDKTFLRPRDVIHYFNICIPSSIGKTSFSWDVLHTAELEYSKSRTEALQYEWQENYPGLGHILKLFKGLHAFLRFREWDDQSILNLLQSTMDKSKGPWLDRFLRMYIDSGESILPTIKIALVTVLFQVGFLGIKPTSQDPVLFSYMPSVHLFAEDLGPESILVIHPAFHRYLGILPRE